MSKSIIKTYEKEQNMINAKVTDIPVPVTRTEHFMYSAITGNESGLEADTQAEMYLDAIKNSDTSGLEGLEPRTVLDMYLEARQTGVVDDLPKPRTTSEMLLYQAITGEDLGAKPVSNMDKYLSLLEPNNYDARLEIESEESVIHLTDSKNGVVEVKELEGNTLINHLILDEFNKCETNGFPASAKKQTFYLKPNTKYTLISNSPNTNTNATIYFNGSTTTTDGVWAGKPVVKTTGNDGSIYVAVCHGRIYAEELFTGTYYMMLLEGDWTGKEIPPYFEGMKSVGECEDNKLEIVSHSSNILDKSLFERVEDSNGSIVYHIEKEIKGSFLERDITYYFKRDNGSNVQCLFYYYDENMKPLQANFFYWAGSNYKIENRPSNAKYFSIIIRPYGNISDYNNDVEDFFNNNYDIRINVDTWHDYKPYQTPNKKEIILNEPLRALPNGVKDKIVKINGKYYVERNCGEYIIDGTSQARTNQSYNLGTEFIMFTKVSDTPVKYPLDYAVISDEYQSIRRWADLYTLTGQEGVSNVDGTLGIGIRVSNTKTGITENDNNITLTNKLLTFFQNNPVKVVYALKTPIYEEITPELQKLILTCYDNATLYFNTNIPPKSLISYTANTSNIYRYLDMLKLSKAERDSIINSMERV